MFERSSWCVMAVLMCAISVVATVACTWWMAAGAALVGTPSFCWSYSGLKPHEKREDRIAGLLVSSYAIVRGPYENGNGAAGLVRSEIVRQVGLPWRNAASKTYFVAGLSGTSTLDGNIYVSVSASLLNMVCYWCVGVCFGSVYLYARSRRWLVAGKCGRCGYCVHQLKVCPECGKENGLGEPASS